MIQRVPFKQLLPEGSALSFVIADRNTIVLWMSAFAIMMGAGVVSIAGAVSNLWIWQVGAAIIIASIAAPVAVILSYHNMQEQTAKKRFLVLAFNYKDESLDAVSEYYVMKSWPKTHSLRWLRHNSLIFMQSNKDRWNDFIDRALVAGYTDLISVQLCSMDEKKESELFIVSYCPFGALCILHSGLVPSKVIAHGQVGSLELVEVGEIEKQMIVVSEGGNEYNVQKARNLQLIGGI